MHVSIECATQVLKAWCSVKDATGKPAVGHYSKSEASHPV